MERCQRQRRKDRRDELLKKLEEGELNNKEREELETLCGQVKYNNWNCESGDWSIGGDRPPVTNWRTIDEWRRDLAERDLMPT